MTPADAERARAHRWCRDQDDGPLGPISSSVDSLAAEFAAVRAEAQREMLGAPADMARSVESMLSKLTDDEKRAWNALVEQVRQEARQGMWLWHRCAGGKVRRYPSLACSNCYPGGPDTNFDPIKDAFERTREACAKECERLQPAAINQTAYESGHEAGAYDSEKSIRALTFSQVMEAKP